MPYVLFIFRSSVDEDSCYLFDSSFPSQIAFLNVGTLYCSTRAETMDTSEKKSSLGYGKPPWVFKGRQVLSPFSLKYLIINTPSVRKDCAPFLIICAFYCNKWCTIFEDKGSIS